MDTNLDAGPKKEFCRKSSWEKGGLVKDDVIWGVGGMAKITEDDGGGGSENPEF